VQESEYMRCPFHVFVGLSVLVIVIVIVMMMVVGYCLILIVGGRDVIVGEVIDRCTDFP
jgi:hypothetical protein